MNKTYADVIFVNGNILTMDYNKFRASAVVVKNGEIVFVGDKSAALLFRGSKTTIIDLKGKTMLPGFIESHTHPTHYALHLLEIDCRPLHAPSIDVMLQRIAEAVKTTPPNQWIRGWGWDDSKLNEKRHPTRWDLDRVAPDHPVFLKRTCSHMLVANTKALEISGITKETIDPPGGHIERNKDTGEPTGLLQEKAQGLIKAPDYQFEDVVKGMKLAQKDFVKWGITTIHDMATETIDLQVYQYMLNSGELKVRMRPWLWAINQNGMTGMLEEVLKVGLRSHFGNDYLKIQGMKFMLDGSIGGRTAAVATPYEGEDSKGILYSDVEEISPFIKQSLAAGLRVAIHGIGERAIEVALQSLEEAQKSLDITHMRNRIEHCALPTTNHLHRMKKLGLIAASSTGFIYHLGDSYYDNLGRERMKRAYPHKHFKEFGIVAPGNSDLPVTDGNPLYGMYAAVTRKSLTGKVLDNEQNISVYDALKAYTLDAADSSFEEELIGRIKPNLKADVIVLSDDPLHVEAERLKEIKVEQTYINGDLVYAE